MTRGVHILAFSTSNYDAMLKFLRDFGFSVIEDPHDQLTPFFEHGRASRVSRGEFEFQLEESESKDAKASFNFFVTDFSDTELEKVKALGYRFEHAEGLYGEVWGFHSPDGGVFVV
jgi:hypothetical protein